MKEVIDAIETLRSEFAAAWREDVFGPTDYRFVDDFRSLGVYRVGLNGVEPRPLDRVGLGRHIRKRAERLGSADAAFSELIQAVESNSSITKFCMILAGLRADKAIVLTPELSLEPLSSIIFTPWVAKRIEEENGYLSGPDVAPLSPGCALVWKVPFEPVLTRTTIGSGQPTLQQTAYLDTIANLLSTVSCKPAAPVLVYITDDDELLPMPGDGMVYKIFGWSANPAIERQAYVVADEIIPFFQDYIAFKGSRQAIDLAARRLSRCVGIGLLEDRAIDLGAALEALLLFAQEGERRETAQEVSYKMGVRAAWLLGSDGNARKKIFREVRELYSIRSTAAHGGNIAEAKWPEVRRQLDAGVIIARRVICAILAKGRWFNWNDLVLGLEDC